MAVWVIFGILLMFTGTFVDSLSQNPVLCRFAEDTTCYAAVGQRLELPFPQGLTVILKKNESSVEQKILKYRTNQGSPPNISISGWNFVTDNKTVIISGAKKNDSGTYRLEITQEGGKSSTVSLQLNVEVPVSSVDVSYSCLPAERSVYCTAEGDELQFSWTSPSQQLDNRNRTLRLDEPDDINVTCHVKNHVSSGNKTIQLQKCPEPTTPTTTSSTTTAVNTQTQSINDKTLIILISIAVVLITVSLIACFMYKRKLAAKEQGSSQAANELVYAHVTHTPAGGAETRNSRVRPQEDDVEYATVTAQSGNRKAKQNTDEVQYGELVFNTTASPKGAIKQQEECVYSQVRQAR